MKILTKLFALSTLTLFFHSVASPRQDRKPNKSVLLIERIGRAIVDYEPAWYCVRGIVTGPRLLADQGGEERHCAGQCQEVTIAVAVLESSKQAAQWLEQMVKRAGEGKVDSALKYERLEYLGDEAILWRKWEGERSTMYLRKGDTIVIIDAGQGDLVERVAQIVDMQIPAI